MIVFSCDKCGFEKRYSGVVKHHMSYMRDFEELSPLYQTEEVHDLCKACFKTYERRVRGEQAGLRERAIAKVKKAFFGITTP